MKRISVAEQTLKKQIDKVKGARAELFNHIDRLNAQKVIYDQMIDDLETEQLHLRKQREAASERVHKESRP